VANVLTRDERILAGAVHSVRHDVGCTGCHNR
jgi:hypothetical protein